jgi:pyruvate formate lyase activating enzyme
MSGLTGLVFDFKHFAVHDGPGIRTTVFLKGCSLKCQWCHSPESQSTNPEIMVHPEKCIGCGSCVEECPKNAVISPGIIDAKVCNLCGKCIEACYPGALELIGKNIQVTEILDEINKDRLLYEASGGGVTLSGGEPAQQSKFTYKLLKALKKNGYNTVLDTCGYTTWDNLKKILKYVDLVFFDLKHMNPIKHKKFTGVSNELILSNLKQIVGLGKFTRIRVPLIPRFNDSEEHLRGLSKFLRELPVETVDILPYHKMGVSKYDSLNREYKLKDIKLHKKEQLMEIKNLISSYGLNVSVAGVE